MSTAVLQSSSTPPGPPSLRAVAAPDDSHLQILNLARNAAKADRLAYAGGISPADAWELVSSGHAVLVDVRTAEERKFVGHVPGSVHVPWMTGLSMNRNPRFVRELENKLAKTAVVLLLCRSGKRSHAAAEALARAGFESAFNVLEGFEGDLNELNQRGSLGGWRRWGLPWVQD